MGKLLIIAFILSFKSMAFDPLIIEEGIEAIANGVSSEIESPRCSESQNNIYDCSRYLKKFEKIKAELVELTTNPEKFGFSAIDLTDASSSKYREKKDRIRARLSRLVQKCQKKRVRKCYGQGQSIDENLLNQKFESWKKNDIYRMPYPSGDCYQRAYLLSQDLKKQGYDVSLLQIGKAPSLIAKVLDDKDNLLDIKPIDYNGIHWVVSIKAKDASGKDRKLLLDPQFATRPMSYQQYFLKTIGQDCGPSDFYEDSGYISTRIKTWKCGYKEFNPARLWKVRVTTDPELKDNVYGISAESILRNDSSCGFDYSHDAQKKIRKDIGDFSFKVEGRSIKSVDDTKSDILTAYKRDFNSLKMNQSSLDSSISRLKKEIEDYKAGSADEFFHFDEAKKNLKEKKKELKLVNRLLGDYEKVIKNIEINLGVK